VTLISAENLDFFGLIYISVYLAIETISLVGIIKENQCIVIALVVLSILGVICGFYFKEIFSGGLYLVITILTGFYAYEIVKYEKQNV
jgi:hypothetical protein